MLERGSKKKNPRRTVRLRQVWNEDMFSSSRRAGGAGVGAWRTWFKTLRILHHGWDRDTHHLKRANQFAADYRHRGQQELLSLLIGLAQDGMAMIERVEELRQLGGVLGQICVLWVGDALLDDVGRFRRGEPEFPEFIAVLAGQEFRKVPGRNVASEVCAESVRIDFGLLENAGRADHRVLRVG